jgi:EAL domain-containing protein (putative c-di-GMP-specific phosphodiesterase class I)/GAF domain-containing protein
LNRIITGTHSDCAAFSCHFMNTVDTAERQRLAALRQMCVLDTPPDPALDRIIALTARLFDAPIVLVSLIDENRQWFKARVGLDVTETPRDQAFCAYAIRGRDVLIVPDATQDPRFMDNPLVTGAPHVRFYAGAPLRTQSGLNVGTLCVIDTKPRDALSQEELALLQDLASLVIVRLETLRSIGQQNQVTGLPNHNRFLDDVDMLVAAQRAGPDLLAAIDVVSPADFHDIVKALGHRQAEQLIVSASERLKATLPAGITIYHIGPVRFAAVFHAGAVPSPSQLLNEVSRAFSASLDCGGIPVNTNPSIGVIPVNGASDAAQLLRGLVTTVDTVRERGKEWDYYDPGIDQAQQRAFTILSALHTALRVKGQLALHFQPRIDFDTGRCVSVEALLRWNHPTMGSISPAEFIPLSETTALIGAVTDWVIPSALRQVAEWRNQGHHFKIAINVSARDIERGDFAEKIASCLQTCGVEPEAIELEFTENALIRNPGLVQEQLSKLRSLGIDVAIDDFGTGYCNIAYLKTLPASIVKIDQSFIRKLSTDQSDRTIVRSMIELAHNLGHRVVAEGIETEESYRLLREWSCDEGQGYMIARPMDADALLQWIEAR